MIIRCRYCKGSKCHIDPNPTTREIRKEICIYCKGKGYMIENKAIMKGGEINKNVIVEKESRTTNI